MIKHAWTVLCDKVIVDRQTNNVSLDSIDQLTVHGMTPSGDEKVVIPTAVTLATLWYRDPGDEPERGAARMRFVSPDGETLGQAELDIDLSERPRARTFGRLGGLPFSSFGTYFFRMELQENGEWHEVAKIPFQIVAGSSEGSDGPSGTA